MAYSVEKGWHKKEYTNTCASDKCGKLFITKWKIKQYCSPPCLARGQYLKLKAKQQAQGKNTRRIPKNPGIRLGMTPEEAAEWHKERVREYNRKNKQRIYAVYKANPKNGWEHRLKEKYKITAADYWRMWEEQGKGCAICGKAAAHDDLKVLHVDHCHSTKKVRGLLCFNCNSMLGHARDQMEVLKRAISYLERTNALAD